MMDTFLNKKLYILFKYDTQPGKYVFTRYVAAGTDKTDLKDLRETYRYVKMHADWMSAASPDTKFIKLLRPDDIIPYARDNKIVIMVS